MFRFRSLAKSTGEASTKLRGHRTSPPFLLILGALSFHFTSHLSLFLLLPSSPPSQTMPSSALRRQSLTPYVPGAWPSCSSEQHDDTAQDADVSSVSSYGSSAVNANARSRKEGYRKTRRRWTYTGSGRPHVTAGGPPGLTLANLAAISPETSSDPSLSPLTVSLSRFSSSMVLNTVDSQLP